MPMLQLHKVLHRAKIYGDAPAIFAFLLMSISLTIGRIMVEKSFAESGDYKDFVNATFSAAIISVFNFGISNGLPLIVPRYAKSSSIIGIIIIFAGIAHLAALIVSKKFFAIAFAVNLLSVNLFVSIERFNSGLRQILTTALFWLICHMVVYYSKIRWQVYSLLVMLFCFIKLHSYAKFILSDFRNEVCQIVEVGFHPFLFNLIHTVVVSGTRLLLINNQFFIPNNELFFISTVSYSNFCFALFGGLAARNRMHEKNGETVFKKYAHLFSTVFLIVFTACSGVYNKAKLELILMCSAESLLIGLAQYKNIAKFAFVDQRINLKAYIISAILLLLLLAASKADSLSAVMVSSINFWASLLVFQRYGKKLFAGSR
jgi:hypothetical protein